MYLNNHTPVEKVKAILTSQTIFDKIELSGISKVELQAKLTDLRGRQVPQRKVFLNLSDEEVTFYWFKNWLHPQLKHIVQVSPKDKRGCSQQVLQQDAERDMLHFYENGQQNFIYTLAQVDAYITE